jgi:adenine-specific DNA-methyltransferase
MTSNYEKLLAKLTEMFQLDQADLDFGIYRIMNSKRDEIVRFLEKDLLPQVKSVLTTAQGDIGTAGAEELATLEKQIRDAGMNPDDSPKVRELRAKSAGGDIGALEQEVFNHLYSFFRRYYDEGDFLSLRRYKEGVYAIPYEGEEVKLHWANADQYYIKTAEHFRDFIFKVGEKRVHFKLVDAQTERDNNKEQEKRVFILAEENPVAEENGELIIRFEYRNDSAKRKQKDLTEAAVTTILDVAPAGWKPLLTTKAPTEKDPNRTILAKRLNDYTSRNTFDYFIHKDLGGFLRRELDFYIKNEVMHLDDIENEAAPKVEQYLAKVRAIRRVASKIIDFLAQLEEFQKALWLKKKFVVDTQYLVTLDRVPVELYPEVIENQAQHDEWIRLFGIDKIKGSLTSPGYSLPLTPEFLRANRSLTINTALFESEFKVRLLSSLGNLEDETRGLLCHAENSQALGLLQARFKGSLQAIYADPPYNTSASEIIYKNSFKHSSWLSLMSSRFDSAYKLLSNGGSFCITIDDFEFHRLRSMVEAHTLPDEILGIAAIKNNPSGRATAKGFSVAHEYAIFVGKGESSSIGRLPHSEEQRARYKEEDDDGSFEWVNFRKHGGANANRYARPKLFYPIFVSEMGVRIPAIAWSDELRSWVLQEQPQANESVVYPTTPEGDEKTWKWGHETARTDIAELRPGTDQAGRAAVYMKARLQDEGTLPRTIWDKKEYSSTEYGTNLVNHIYGEKEVFAFPKSVHAVVDCLKVCNFDAGWVLDFFAGSGTTAHACISMNREDAGSRRFISVEMGRHFDSALVTRIRRIVYSPDWTDGKPRHQSLDGQDLHSLGVIKVIKLESYDDALHNIVFHQRSTQQASILERSDSLRETYLLKYILSAETSESPSTLNVQAFDHPFEYKLKVATDTFGETKEVNVDLVETFNWLLGLRVHTMDVIRGFHVVTGRLPGQGNSENGEKALIIWRDTTENPNEKLDEFFGKQAYNTQDQEFDVIYVNGDNNLQNLRKDDQTWKVRLIEEEFHRLMWDVEDI